MKRFLISVIAVTPSICLAQSDIPLPPPPPHSSSVQTDRNQTRCGGTRNGVDVERWMTSQECSNWIAEMEAQSKEVPSPDHHSGRGRDGIPLQCNSREMVDDAVSNIPNLLDLGPDAARIEDVKPSANIPRIMYYPSIEGRPGLYMIECPVSVKFSNGLEQYGVFEEWTDKYGQDKVYFGSQFVSPIASD